MSTLHKWIYKLNFLQKGISVTDLKNEYMVDNYSTAEVENLQKDRLRDFLLYCKRESPFYTERFKTYNVDLEADDIFFEIKKMPPIGKQEIRDNLDKIIPAQFKDKTTLIKKATGGSTGTPLVVWGDKEDYRQNGLIIARQRQWIGWQGGMKTFTLFGGFRDIPSQTRAMIKELVLNEKFINIMDRNHTDYDQIANEIIAFEPEAIIGYFSLLQEVGKTILKRNVKINSLKLLIAAAEPLNEQARERVEMAFGVPVYFQYGNRELGTFAQECSQKRGYHYAQDHYYCEVLDDEYKDAEYGNLTLTYFDNLVTPLIRYQTGDGACIDTKPCSCGLPYHRLGVIDGRLASMIMLPSGEKITSNLFPHVFKDYAWIDAFQVEQVSTDRLYIRAQKISENFKEESFRELNDKLLNMLGKEIRLEWKFDEPFLSVPTGKHIYFISNIGK